MKTIKLYKIITETSVKRMEGLVNLALTEGFEPWGAMLLNPAIVEDSTATFIQPMVMYQDLNHE